MSGIYGIYRFDGGWIDPDYLEAMRSAMAFYGPHGGRSHVEGPLGMGHLLLKVAPEDTYEMQPEEGIRGPVIAAARLDNREELIRVFDIPPGAEASTSDGHLVTLAFDRWGEEVGVHLQGDWAMAGWDRHQRKLLLARDALGSATLYLHQASGFIAFASSLKALLAIPSVARKPDLMRLAQVLIGWQHDAERTAYEGFQRLVWAHSLTVRSDGQKRCWCYWSPEGREPVYYPRDQNYEEAFLDHYTRAVKSCLRTEERVGATLSGGRDSGSVTAIAAPLLACRGKELAAYTSIPCLPTDGAPQSRVGNEWEQAHVTVQMAGTNVQHIGVDAANYGVLQGIEDLLAIHDGPSHAASNHYWIKAIVDTAVRDGAGVLLTGQMGNGTISWAGNGSALLALIGGHPRIAWQLFLQAEPTPWLTFKRQVIKPALIPGLRFFRQFQSRSVQFMQSSAALNPRMASSLGLEEGVRATGFDPTFTVSPLEDQRPNFLKPSRSIGAGIWSEIGATNAISIRDPTSNLAMLEFLLRVPDSQFRRCGEGSSLFRRTLRNRLPKPVLEGRRKGLQSADVGHRVVRERLAIEQCLDDLDSHPIATDLLNIPLMRTCLTNLAAKVDPETTMNANMILLRGLGVGMFLCQLG